MNHNQTLTTLALAAVAGESRHGDTKVLLSLRGEGLHLRAINPDRSGAVVNAIITWGDLERAGDNMSFVIERETVKLVRSIEAATRPGALR